MNYFYCAHDVIMLVGPFVDLFTVLSAESEAVWFLFSKVLKIKINFM